MAAQGMLVAIHYNASEEAARHLLDTITSTGGHAAHVQGDMSKAGESERIVAEATARFD